MTKKWVRFPLQWWQLVNVCFQDDPEYVKAIMTLCAMGLWYGDIALATLATQELAPLKPEVIGHLDLQVGELLAYVNQANNKNSTLQRALLKTIHGRPWHAEPWCRLGEWIAIYRYIDG